MELIVKISLIILICLSAIYGRAFAQVPVTQAGGTPLYLQAYPGLNKNKNQISLATDAENGKVSAMKNTIDIVGFRLGMNSNEAKRLLESYSPKLNIFDVLNNKKEVIGLSGYRLDPKNEYISGNCYLVPRNNMVMMSVGSSAGPCTEQITLMFIESKVWYVGRLITYSRGIDSPSYDDFNKALVSKYGVVAEKSNFKNDYFSNYFNKHIEWGFKGSMPASSDSECGRPLKINPPNKFDGMVDWTFNINIKTGRQDSNKSTIDFVDEVIISATDCAIPHNYYTNINNEQIRIQREQDERLRATTPKPKL